MADTFIVYPNASGGQTTYAVPFEYLSTTFVKAAVNGVSAPFTFLSTYMIEFDTAPSGVLVIYRDTNQGTLINTYLDGSVLRDAQLNTSYWQNLHVSEETADRALRLSLLNQWDAKGKVIKGVPTPTADDHATNKKYVDDADEVLQGNIDELREYVDDQDAALKAYVDTQDAALQAEIDAVEVRTADLEDRMDDAEERLDGLEPYYDDTTSMGGHVWFEDPAGNVILGGDSRLEFDHDTKTFRTPAFDIVVGGDDEELLVVEDSAGNQHNPFDVLSAPVTFMMGTEDEQTLSITDAAGNSHVFGDLPVDLRLGRDDEQGIFMEDGAGNTHILSDALPFEITLGDPYNPLITLEDEAGNTHILADYTGDVSVGEAVVADASYFTKAELKYVNDRAAAKALDLESEDVSGWAEYRPGANMRYHQGQSFTAGAAFARLLATTSWMAIQGWYHNAWSVGPDSRCVSGGATYITYGSDTRILHRLSEKFVYPTGTDNFYTDIEIAAGDYPDNARGGTPETVSEIVFNHLRQAFYGSTDTVDTTRWSLVLNGAKTDGTLNQISSGDGLARGLHAFTVAKEGILAAAGSAPSTVAAGVTTEPKHCDFILWNHGEAAYYLDDEADPPVPGTPAQYVTQLCDLDDDYFAEMQVQFGTTAGVGQDKRHRMLMLQDGGPRYGDTELVTQQAMVSIMTNRTGRNLGKFLVGTKYEVSSPLYMTTTIGWSQDNNGHPLQSGNAMMAIRFGVAMYYLSVRNEPYWIPFPYEVFVKGNKFLIGVPCKFPPMREAAVTVGHFKMFLDHKGITFEDDDAIEVPVQNVRVVADKLYGYLIEGIVDESVDLLDYPIMKAGKRQLTGPNKGATNFLDQGPRVDIPITLPFNKNNTVGPEGYQDSPATNGFGRYLEDIPGYVGKPDLGNWMACHVLTATALPAL